MILSSLIKVFSDEKPAGKISHVEGFINETISFQSAHKGNNYGNCVLMVKIISPIQEFIRVRDVQTIPVLSNLRPSDDYVLRRTPGLYPDLLTELDNNVIYVSADIWRGIWFDIENAPPGTYPIEVQIVDGGDNPKSTTSLTATIHAAKLPKQKLIRTDWFHADCLAGYYQVEVWSEEHWRIVRNFIEVAVKRGTNMITTPTFTLPLDTEPGLERITTQLVDVEVNNDQYSFGFERLRRWVDMCHECGGEYFEIAHLFSQWGAKHAPKVMATVDGEYKRIFGWETDSIGEEYKIFLGAYLTELTAFLKEMGIGDKCYFHISDEPQKDHFERYKACRQIVAPYLKDFKIIDAMSEIEYFRPDVADIPIPATSLAAPFFDVGMKEPWLYYACGELNKVSNLFVQFPSARNRILGVQLYKYAIQGFLYWGFNFYNTYNSFAQLDPYRALDNGGFPAGNSYQVYPGRGGVPEESIRLMVVHHSMQDLRALQMLEGLTNRDFVIDIIEEGLDEPISLTEYPRNDTYLLDLRNRVNHEIMKRV